MTEPTSHCPDCGTALPADSPQALCPACLMKQALASRTIVNGGEHEPVAPPLSPEELAEKFPGFEILECLGRGGMGVVYKARQKSLGRLVAIKILPPERVGEARFADRFAIEAATLAKLNHPNIVTVYDFGVSDSQPSTPDSRPLYFIVMEFVDGVNLRDLLREGKLEPKQALAIVPPICEALQYAHDKGIVHRDIKPENLLLDKDGRVKIADFGIASLMGAAGEIAGTPPYMAPEQNGRSTDHRADIYALGVVLYEMLTGERPGKDLVAPSRKVQIDVRLDEMVLRALEKEPERRYQTAEQFRTVVETMASPRPVEPDAVDESAQRKKRRKKVVFRLLDPLPSKRDLLRTALTMLLAGLAIIALVSGAWERARQWMVEVLGPGFSLSEPISTISLVACIAAILFLISKVSRWGIPGSHKPNIAGFWNARRVIAGLMLTMIALAVCQYLWPSKSYPTSSISPRYKAPVIGRIVFKCSHAEAVAGVGNSVSFDVKAWGDTQWQPSSGQNISIEGGRTISFKTRVDACRSNPPAAMVTASLNGKDWETRKIELRPEPPVQSLDFTNGLRVTVRWSPVEVPDLNGKSPDPIQHSVMRGGSERADQQHPLTDIKGPQAFGHVTERVVYEMESGLGNEALRLESGELLSLPKSKTNEWLDETSASLLVGKTGPDFQLIIHKGILRDMNNADWDHATPEAFRRAMEKGPGMMKPGKSENRWAAYDWTGGEVPATFGFHLASGAQGMLQVMGDTPDGAGLRIRYKLLPGPNGETILPPDFERVRDCATAIARRHYPDFKINMDGDRFLMQRNLREYEVHNPSKSGDVSAETHKETGPAADGFQLVLEPLVEAPVSQAFQADGPQILDRPYWKGFVDHRFDPRNNSGVSIFFDFGPAVKVEFKDQILRLLDEEPKRLEENDERSLTQDPQGPDSAKAINDTNQFLDLELAVIDAKASGLGDQHPTVNQANEVLARFKEAHPEIPDTVWRQLVSLRLDKAREELSFYRRNGLGENHPVILVRQARIRALTEMSDKPDDPANKEER